MSSEGSNLAASVMKGKRVLTRRDEDGYYYLGIVIDVVCKILFFTLIFPLKAFCCRRQETKVLLNFFKAEFLNLVAKSIFVEVCYSGL